jgi:hypothetical protein
MQRSSETIGAIAAALAKAQVELANPGKSCTATLRSTLPGGGDRRFRYAPLSSGLEIVRKCLGRHEIAIVQTTAIDHPSGLVRLTTVLAHSSGEWISSDWPVCPVSETAAPQRMGAALTYARRYALFTLVGIAGDDDLDAPDLAVTSGRKPSPMVTDAAPITALFKGHAAEIGPKSPRSPQRQPITRPPRPILSSDQSAALRDQLLAEDIILGTDQGLLAWAHRTLPAENSLTAEDACAIEHAFEVRTPDFGASDPARPGAEHDVKKAAERTKIEIGANEDNTQASTSVMKVRCKRDKDHLKFVSAQPCLVCGRQPCDAHHLRFAQPRALGRKVSDEFTVPLCRAHHRELHDRGDEAVWWAELEIDAVTVAQQLWTETH